MVLLGGGELARRLGEVLALVEHTGTPVVIAEQRVGGQPFRVRATIVPGWPREAVEATFVDLDGKPVTKEVTVNGFGHGHGVTAHA